MQTFTIIMQKFYSTHNENFTKKGNKKMDFKDEEKYLIKLLDETKRLIVADNVIRENGLSRFKEQVNEDRMTYARSTGDVLNEKIKDNLLTVLMVTMGYRIPNEIYSMNDYSELCDFLGNTDEDGKQRWIDD